MTETDDQDMPAPGEGDSTAGGDVDPQSAGEGARPAPSRSQQRAANWRGKKQSPLNKQGGKKGKVRDAVKRGKERVQKTRERVQKARQVAKAVRLAMKGAKAVESGGSSLAVDEANQLRKQKLQYFVNKIKQADKLTKIILIGVPFVLIIIILVVVLSLSSLLGGVIGQAQNDTKTAIIQGILKYNVTGPALVTKKGTNIVYTISVSYAQPASDVVLAGSFSGDTAKYISSSQNLNCLTDDCSSFTWSAASNELPIPLDTTFTVTLQTLVDNLALVYLRFDPLALADPSASDSAAAAM